MQIQSMCIARSPVKNKGTVLNEKNVVCGRFVVSHDATGNLGRISNCQLGRGREVKGLPRESAPNVQ